MKNWWKAALVRAVKTMCQAAVAMIPIGTIVTVSDFLAVFDTIISIVLTAIVAGILSILTSIAGIPEVEDGESVFAIDDQKKIEETLAKIEAEDITDEEATDEPIGGTDDE